MAPGSHEIDIHTWRPVGSVKDQVIGIKKSVA
jgi:hypothetical protein